MLREFDQFFRFAGVEVARNPSRLLAFDAQLVQLIASALKNKQPMTKLLEVS